MRKFILLILLICSFGLCANAATVEGGVEKLGLNNTNQIIDSRTKMPISNAEVILPKAQFKTYTDSEGRFALGAKVDGQTIVSVEKEGYKPFSMTIDEKIAARPIILGIEKTTPNDIKIDSSLIHIGDNNFSDASANAGQFKSKSSGPSYSKSFKITDIKSDKTPYLVIGSIIGIDTKMAKSMGQNKISGAFSCPPEVYFNGNKIAEIQLNGDGQKIKIPANLIRANQMNNITIRAGKNLMQTAYVDYDDIEFMNLSIENN